MPMLCNPAQAGISPAWGMGCGHTEGVRLRMDVIYGLSRRGLCVKAGTIRRRGQLF